MALRRRDVDVNVAAAQAEAKRGGYFSKESRAARQEGRAISKILRAEAKTKRRADRRAKRGARPLHHILVGGFRKFKDILPKVRRKKDGSGYVKTNPDGSVEEVASKNVTQLPPPTGSNTPVLIDKTDVAGKAIATEVVKGVAIASALYEEAETEAITDDAGNVQVYKLSDVEDKSGLFTTQNLMILLGVGVVGALVVYGLRRQKGK